MKKQPYYRFFDSDEKTRNAIECFLHIKMNPLFKQFISTCPKLSEQKEKSNYEPQKTCGLRYDVPGINRNSRAESSADERNPCHRQGHQPAPREGRSRRSRRVLAGKFP